MTGSLPEELLALRHFKLPDLRTKPRAARNGDCGPILAQGTVTPAPRVPVL